MAISISLE
ncbi:hypothetical protein D050_1652A, partial [Vibrio parahaemolyticus VPCR-2009]